VRISSFKSGFSPLLTLSIALELHEYSPGFLDISYLLEHLNVHYSNLHLRLSHRKHMPTNKVDSNQFFSLKNLQIPAKSYARVMSCNLAWASIIINIFTAQLFVQVSIFPPSLHEYQNCQHIESSCRGPAQANLPYSTAYCNIRL